MARVEKSITINAPVEKVFNYIDAVINLPEIWPSIVEVKDVELAPGGGKNFKIGYRMLGMRFENNAETIEYLANERTVTRTTGGIESKVTWTYQPESGGTRVTFNSEYTVPVPLLGKLAERYIVKANESEAELVLSNLKDRMEV